ncbi:MAG TPA: hypothetical protein VH309_03580 [Elusimicrobiota bacterium]|nr:hypothetical protein [Elusimicrobiota bacterium]
MSLLDFIFVLFVLGVSGGLTLALLLLAPIAMVVRLAWGRDA